MEGGVASRQFFLSSPLSSVSQNRTKLINLFVVLSSYCNNICSMACCQGGLTVQIDISCCVFVFTTLKSYFVASWEKWQGTMNRFLRHVTDSALFLRPIPIHAAVHRCKKCISLECVHAFMIKCLIFSLWLCFGSSCITIYYVFWLQNQLDWLETHASHKVRIGKKFTEWYACMYSILSY